MQNAFVEWDDSFLVGNRIIDEQHMELVKMANEFYANCQAGGVIAKVSFLNTLKGAVHYVKTHFSTEEEIMQKIQFPDFEIHKKRHDEFVSEVQEQAKMFENEDNPNPAKFVKYLMDWVVEHIAAMDKKYVPYIARLEQ